MSPASSRFAARGDHDAIELGPDFAPKFDADGLIVAIAVDSITGEVLMVAHMNEEALARTIETGSAWFFSRSRRKLWRKGEESGNTLTVKEMRVDCDQDAILLKVEMAGDAVACHQGYRSCFYRTVPVGAKATPDLKLGLDHATPRVPPHRKD
jgi:phosphoribosyl-AMP cyclohydrolase